MIYLDVLEFQRRIEEAENIAEIVANRLFELGYENERVELVRFCDSSGKGYTAWVYIRVRHTHESMSTVLMTAKTKLKCLTQQTISRLGLLSDPIANAIIETSDTDF